MKGERAKVVDGQILTSYANFVLRDGEEMCREAPCGCAFLLEGDSILPCSEHRKAAMRAVQAIIQTKS